MHLWKLLLLLRLCSALAFTPSRHSIQKFQKLNALSRNTPFSRYSLSVESNLRLASRSDDEDDGRGAESVYSDLALENPLVLSLATSFIEVFMIASKLDNLSLETLVNWESKLEKLISEIKQLKDKDVLLGTYWVMLSKVSVIQLNPMQVSTFEKVVDNISDGLLRIQDSNVPITALIDDITQLQLDFIEKFRVIIDDGGSEGYSQSSNQELLCYQFAGIIRKIYDRISKTLGNNFDASLSTQSLRLSNWVTPVYARLQRRFVRFLASNVEEKLLDLNAESFDRFLDAVKFDVMSPRYGLYSATANASTRDVYPPWKLAEFIIKVIRYTVREEGSLGLDMKVINRYQRDLASRMRVPSKPLEQIYNEKKLVLNTKEHELVEEMLNLGHVAVSAIITTWHIRHNIIGVPDPKEPTKLVKDFLKPVILLNKDGAMDSIPKYIRDDIVNDVDDLSRRVESPSSALMASAVVAHAVRYTAAEEYRALITYNSDDKDWPMSRDATYVALLSSVLEDYILYKDDSQLNENLIACAALEETIGVREPRSACTQAYDIALQRVCNSIITNADLALKADSFIAKINNLEGAITLVLRLPDGVGKKVRVAAFKSILEKYIATSSSISELDSFAPVLARVLSINADQAKAFVEPLKMSKFDKTIGSILMNSDMLSLSTSLDALYKEEFDKLLQSVKMPHDAAVKRVEYIAAAIFQSYLEVSYEESRKVGMGANNANNKPDSLLRKAFSMGKHPIFKAIGSATPLIDNAVLVMSKKYEKDVQYLMNIIKMLESYIQLSTASQASNSVDSNVNAKLGLSAGWGGSLDGNDDKNYIEFLTVLQAALLKVYTVSSLKTGYR